MFETRADNPGTVLYLQTIFSASVILHEILLRGRYVVQDKLKFFFFFFSCWAWAHPTVQLLEAGGVCTVENWFGWKFALHAVCISLLSQGSWWAFCVRLPSPAVEPLFPSSVSSSVGFPPVHSANSPMASPPADKASVPGECVRGGFSSLHHRHSQDAFSRLSRFSLWVSGEVSEENPTKVRSQPRVYDSQDPPILRLACCQPWEIANHCI